MVDEKTANVIVLLAHDALEATNDEARAASITLADAALSILATRYPAEIAREAVKALAAYLVDQGGAVIEALAGEAA